MNQNPQLDPSQYSGPRAVLHILGPLILAVGVIFMIVGFVDFFGSMGSFGGPKLFWCFFVGMPLLFVGGAMTATEYQGAILRYHAGESAPVLRDTFNYMADGTKSSVKDMAAAVSAGLSQGLGRNSAAVRCYKCNAENPADAKFCNKCGAELGKTRACPECNELNDPDARFCDNCGKPMKQSNV